MGSIVAVAALAAAAVVSVLLHRHVGRRRRVRRELVAQRLMAGCVRRDNAALHAQVEVFRRRLDASLAEAAVVVEAERALDAALARHAVRIDPFSEGGPV